MNNLNPKVTLDQWKAFHAVVEYGGYAQAAEQLHKSQSTLSYAVQKLESVLELKVLKVEGRKAQLTREGEVLLRRSKQLLESAVLVERVAHNLSLGVEAVVHLGVDVLFMHDDLLALLAQFSTQFPDTRVELRETVLSGGHELLNAGVVDVLITATVPSGFVGDPLMNVEMACVASVGHPLNQLERKVTLEDLKHHRQIVTRDSGQQRKQNAPWLEAEQRWTVSNMSTSIRAISQGMGFAWIPLSHIGEHLQQGKLKAIDMAQGGSRFVQLYLVYKDKDGAGPATCQLTEILHRYGEQHG